MNDFMFVMMNVVHENVDFDRSTLTINQLFKDFFFVLSRPVPMDFQYILVLSRSIKGINRLIIYSIAASKQSWDVIAFGRRRTW